MTLTFDISPDMETRLQEEAAKHGQDASVYAHDALRGLLGLEPEPTEADIRDGWDALTKLIEECQMDTGISDLAHRHDHYLYGTPKREEYAPEA